MEFTEDFNTLDAVLPSFRPDLLPDTLKKYALELTAFLLFLLRVTPLVHRPTRPLPADGDKAPLPRFEPPGQVEDHLTYSCEYPELHVTPGTVSLVNAFRKVLLIDVADHPNVVKDGSRLPRNAPMEKAIHTLLLGIFSAKYKGNPARGVTPHEQFIIISSLADRPGEPSHQDARAFSPRLAAFEYVFRLVAFREILSELPPPPETEMSVEEVAHLRLHPE